MSVSDPPLLSTIKDHYGHRGDLSPVLHRVLKRNDLSPTSETLREIDQFHTRGHRATAELAKLTGLETGQHLLDLGCGIGGPARQAAHDCGVQAVGLDLTENYCRSAREITSWIQPALPVSFVCGNATELPFSDTTFDVVWLQHTGMNIADKAILYREIARVLKPEGKLGLHEIVAGEKKDVIYPTPWAAYAEQSHLLPPEALRQLIHEQGFRENCWLDKTEKTRETQKRLHTQNSQGQTISAAAILGPDFMEMANNLYRNLEASRLAVIMAVFRKLD